MEWYLIYKAVDYMAINVFCLMIASINLAYNKIFMYVDSDERLS